jgi:catechol 2,3-dioxygenase-like lactoylglutathione lyase family enzyme
MGLPDGVHHLAIATGNIKAQIEFFTQVVGMELVALYWMHGAPGAFHCFLRLNDTSSLAFVQMPAIQTIVPQPGVTHADSAAGPVAPGVMQHVALRVASDDDLLALRDRLRSHGVWVLGPIDHGMCTSMYLSAPEGIVLEFATSAAPIDADQWLDPEVVALCGIDAAELARYRCPADAPSHGGAVPQPDPAVRHDLHFSSSMEPLRAMSDADISAHFDFRTPPVPRRRA